MTAEVSTRAIAHAQPINAAASMTWMIAGSVLTRLLGLVGQILLGWLLLPADFGVYALAISIVTVVTALRSGGIVQVAIQNGPGFDGLVSQYLRYAFGFNILAMVVLFCLALPYIVSGSATGMVLAGIALSIPAGTHASIARIKLTIDGRFRELSTINFWSALVWQASVVICALLGFGAHSFVLPSLLQALYESAATWRIAKITKGGQRNLDRKSYWKLFLQCRWIMLGAAMLALATTGDYFAVSMLTNAVTVGTYFFAFQLIAAICVPINSSIESVLPAYLLSRAADCNQLDAYLRTVRLLVVISMPLSVAVALSAPIAIQLLWQGRWDGAAAATQTLAMCIPAWLLTTVGRSLVEARAMWRGRFAMMALYGIGGMTSAAVGSLIGDVGMISLCVAIFYACFALGLQFWLSTIGVTIGNTMKALLLPLMANVIAALVSVEVMMLLQEPVLLVARQCISLIAFLILSSAANAVFFRTEWRQLHGLILGRIAALKPR